MKPVYKEGDIVRCIKLPKNNSANLPISIGKLYEITSCITNEKNSFFKLKESDEFSFSADLFEKAILTCLGHSDYMPTIGKTYTCYLANEKVITSEVLKIKELNVNLFQVITEEVNYIIQIQM